MKKVKKKKNVPSYSSLRKLNLIAAQLGRTELEEGILRGKG